MADRLTPPPPAPISPNVLSRAVIEAAAAGDNTIIAAPGAGKRILLYHYNFLTRAAVNARLLSGAASVSGLYNFGANSGFAFDAPGGIAPTPLGVNEAFVINLSAAVGIDGYVLYLVANA